MKSILSISALVISLTASPAFSSSSTEDEANSNTEQGIGLGAGAVTGGLIAGPIGIVPGALIGALMGQNIASDNDKNHLSNKNHQLQNQLQNYSAKLQSLEEDNSKQLRVVIDAHRTIERLLVQNQELKNHALNFEVKFRTDSIKIENNYQKYLSDLAEALNATPNMEIEVAGYADRIGDEDYNMELSNKRASQVKDYLIKKGVNEDLITTLAYGENQPLSAQQSLENNFFDRRVTVYLRPIELSADNIADEIIALEKDLSVAANEK